MIALLVACVRSQSSAPSNTTIFDGARLIVGDGSAPIQDGAFVVQAGRIVSIGEKSAIKAPTGATRVNLTGKAELPTLINPHVHIGYEGCTSWGPQNYTPQNVLDHLEREAFYGVSATQSVGSSPTDPSIQRRSHFSG